VSPPRPTAASQFRRTEAVPKRSLVIILAVLAIVILGGFAVLATIDIPAPSTRIERVIPNDRLPR
jgi:hypothetical protein